MKDDWISAEVWAKCAEESSAGTKVVYDGELGCLVEMTAPDGTRCYGVDPARRQTTGEGQ